MTARSDPAVATRFDAATLARRPRAAMSTLFGLAFVVGGFRIGLARLDDNSFLWHFRTGRLILDDGIPRHDVFSYTVPGSRWVAQSWLAELLYGLLDRAAGPVGVRFLTGALGAALGWTCWRIAVGAAHDRLRAAGIGLVAFVTALNVFGERPLSYGLVGAALLVLAVEQPGSWIGRRPLVALPVLFWVWGNTHGSMSLGYVYVALHLAGRWLDGVNPWRSARERSIAVATLLSVVVLIANPYGVGLLLFPLELVTRGEVLSGVVEWMSPDFRSLLGMAFAAWLTVLIVTLTRGANRPARRDLVVVVPFVLLGLWAQRNVGIAAIMTLPVAGRAVATRARAEDANPRFVLACGALLALLVVVFSASAVAEPDFDLRGYPVRAFEYLDERELIGERIFTTDRDAGFVIAKYWPRQRVFLDDRFDMYPASIVADYEAISDAKPSWDDVLERYGVTVVVWEKSRGLAQLLAIDERWEQVYSDKEYVVFLRR